MSPDVGGMVASLYFKSLTQAGVRFTVLRRLHSIERNADGTLTVALGIEDDNWTETRVVDAVVFEGGTTSTSDVYDELVPLSSNGGEVVLDDLLAGRPQVAVRNPEGTFQVFRIGDAVSSRNVHAAILDAVRLCRAI